MVTYQTIPATGREIFAARRSDNKIYLSAAARRALGDPTYIAVGLGKSRRKSFLLTAVPKTDPGARQLYSTGALEGRFSCAELFRELPEGKRVELVHSEEGLEVKL